MKEEKANLYSTVTFMSDWAISVASICHDLKVKDRSGLNVFIKKLEKLWYENPLIMSIYTVLNK